MAKVFSAPGKAFIAGGYLVLEPQYSSYITALSAHTHASVKLTPNDEMVINISSPQFISHWSYTYHDNKWTEVNGNKNPFLQATVEIVMKYFGDVGGKIIDITIFSDAGFHTQDNTVAKSSQSGSKTFLFHNKPITEVAKTGLGSSASLVSVVTMALVSTFKNETMESLRNLVHNLAQVAHCKAQKKIGSGFDVATAVYGSINYQRFKPELINDFINDEIPDVSTFQAVINSHWEFTHERCSLPPHLKILMGDIKGGSETPKLVSLVLAWKKANPQQALQLYTNLNNANLTFIKCLGDLHHYYETDRPSYLDAIENLKTGNHPVSQPFMDLINAIKSIRYYLKQLTINTKADIEPDAQTTLLDKAVQLPGVIGGVVPGAGGYDAISLIVVDTAIPSIVNTASHDTILSVVNWLDLEEESQGIIEEDINDYQGL